jgi:hypothetical protein
MTTQDFLKEAIKITSGDRELKYGNKVKNHCNIASLWSAYLGREITARDVALMMTLLKVARTKIGEHTDDHYIDGAGYMAIAGEIADDNQNEKKPEQLSFKFTDIKTTIPGNREHS